MVDGVRLGWYAFASWECVKRHIYATRDDARSDIVDYIEMFYNGRRRHGFNNLLSPVEFEKRFSERLISV